jgi:branched-chain amino acid transport system permease protein
MSGYLSQVGANLLISVILAYAAYLPLATGLLNLGIAGFMAVGAYASAVAAANLALPVALCIGLGTLCAMLVGVLVAFSVSRMDGIYLSLATFAFAEVVTAILVNVNAVGGADGYVVNGYIALRPIVITACVVVGGVAYLMSTRIGLILTAVRNDERAAAIFGVSVPGVKLLAVVLGAGLAGLAGGLYGHHYSYIEAQNFNFTLSANAVLFALFGGIQTWRGPLLGASAITLIPEALRTSGEWRYIGFGAIMVVLMVWWPEGLLTRGALHRMRLRRA